MDLIGIWNYFYELFKSIRYKFNDLILDYLVEIIDEKVLGYENIYRGISTIQQWDDIIRTQRRYFLISRPDGKFV